MLCYSCLTYIIYHSLPSPQVWALVPIIATPQIPQAKLEGTKPLNINIQLGIAQSCGGRGLPRPMRSSQTTVTQDVFLRMYRKKRTIVQCVFHATNTPLACL